PILAGPRTIGVSFVRELWEPEGLPQPLQRGRVLTNDQIYMGYASVGAVTIGGPYQVAGTAGDTPSRRAIFVCQPASERSGAGPGGARERSEPSGAEGAPWRGREGVGPRRAAGRSSCVSPRASEAARAPGVPASEASRAGRRGPRECSMMPALPRE